MAVAGKVTTAAAPVQSKLAPKAAAQSAAPVQHATATPGAISLNPATFTQGGFLEGDVVIADAAFLVWDYEGKSTSGDVPALGITFHKLDDGANPPQDHDQYYSCGKLTDFVPSNDGASLMPVGSKAGLNMGTNAALFLASLLQAGFPPDQLDGGNIKSIVGTQVTVAQVPAPERTFATPQKEGSAKKTICVVTRVLALPGETTQAPAKVAATVQRPTAPARTQTATVAPTTATSASPSNTNGTVAPDDLTALATATLIELAQSKGGSIARKDIGPGVFTKLKGNPQQTPAMKLAFSEEFLMSAGDGAWVYDGGVVTLTA